MSSLPEHTARAARAESATHLLPCVDPAMAAAVEHVLRDPEDYAATRRALRRREAAVYVSAALDVL